MIEISSGRVVALCGGVGGAKLALGLQEVLGEQLHIAVNMADDFVHLGLRICPDLDTVLYTLGRLNDEQRGWGRANETWNFMETLRELGGEAWFNLGDRDMGLHVERTLRLARGETLSEVAAHFARRFGIRANILPVTDDDVRTIVTTDIGELEFQRYFVERQCKPVLKSVAFRGARDARLSAGVVQALRPEGLRMVIICPSNPYLSIDPVLAIPGLKEALGACGAPVIAVSPIIAGQAVKGPTRKIMDELKIPATSDAIAAHYRGLIDGLVIDAGDELLDGGGIGVLKVPTLMTDLESKIRLAEDALGFGDSLRR